MTMSSNYSEEALFARESLFRQKLNKLRTTGEIQRMSRSCAQSGFKEIEQNFYLNNTSTILAHENPRQLEKLALLDSLTELYNHDTISRMLKDEVRRAQRYKKEVSVLALTIDNFPEVTKQGGPIACDFILKATAQMLMQSIRDVDIPGRYDRDHFIFICPETTLTGATCLANRLCNNVSSERIAEGGKQWQITISIGIASFPDTAQNEQQLLDLAFRSLILAERSGGNNYHVVQADAKKYLR